jgi:hypothetical protein
MTDAEKKMKIKIVFVLFASIALVNIAVAQSKVGTTAANFLKIPQGARATAMGGAFTAVANDASAAFWNPGGLSRITGNEFIASDAKWIVGTNTYWFGLAIKAGDNGCAALSVNELDYGNEEITTATEPDGTGQTWSARDVAIGLSYAQNLTDRFSIGGTAKYIHQSIWNESASAFALDVGLLFTTQLDNMRIGMNIANFGTELKMDGKDAYLAADVDPTHTGNNETIVSELQTDSWTLPLTFTIGLGYDPLDNDKFKWSVAVDAVYPNSQTSYLNMGTEITWNKMISLRAGYFSLFKEAAEEGLTAGVGVQYDLGEFLIKADYSYSEFGILGEISRYTISVGF